MSVANYNNQTYLLYSKYGGDHSDVMGIPIGIESHLSEALDVYDFARWNGTFPEAALTSGSEEINPVNRTNLSKLNLSPYSSSNSQLSSLNSQLDFRFTYTGREFNIESGNYYYRFRTYDSMIGRFTSKDPIENINLYFYASNKSPNYSDPFGRKGHFSPPYNYTTCLTYAFLACSLPITIGYIEYNKFLTKQCKKECSRIQNNIEYLNCISLCESANQFRWKTYTYLILGCYAFAKCYCDLKFHNYSVKFLGR